MPFTLLHMGPGMAVKAVCNNRFSLISFGIAQVVIDIEPLVGLLLERERLHSYTHTYLAAAVFTIFTVAVSMKITRPLLCRFNSELLFCKLGWLATDDKPDAMPVIYGALTGTFSHIFLDSIFHSDMTPFIPWLSSNSLYGKISTEQIELLCLASGIIGVIFWLSLKWHNRHKTA